MKQAKLTDGRPVLAGPDAPPTAICPHCGGTLLLRQRRRMNKTVTYYWRHRSNQNVTCSGRRRPTG